MKYSVSIVTAATLALLGAAGQAAAYTPKWLQCDGQLVVTGGEDAGTRPAHDYYIYDDDNKNLFTWLEAKKAQSLEPVKLYNDNEIRWSMEGGGINNARWEGRIDRKTLGLRLDYRETGSTRTWTEQCKPTTPLESSVSANADTTTPAMQPSAAAKSGQ